jgi:RING finger protein 121/175
VYQATRVPLSKGTPKNVFLWFNSIYFAAYAVGIAGYCLILLTVMTHLPLPGPLLLFYGAYFAVLDRDFAEVCTMAMASRLGVYSKDGLPQKSILPGVCALCTESLDDEGGKVVTLNCKHQYHHFCIRGWAIVGKKDVCPYCKEKVDMKETFQGTFLGPQSPAYIQTLDFLRSLIVWNPVIIVVTMLVLRFAGYS